MGSNTDTVRAVLATALIAVSALVLAGCTGPADAEPDRRDGVQTPFDEATTGRLNAALADAVTLSGSSGAIAGVWAPWAGAWEASPGTTTLGGSEPLTTDMRFRVGENTRSMTCTVLLRLAEEGTVKLSDPVATYLDRMSEIDGITLGQLCQNTSGLPDYTAWLAPQFVNNPTRTWPPLEVVSHGLAVPRVGDPGTTVASSRTGLVLLGMALETATNKDWPTLYRQYVFGPLGMSDTSFPEGSDLGIPGPHPHGYSPALTATGQPDCAAIRDETRLSPSMAWVSGGAVSTVSDLGVWARALAEGSLLEDTSVKAQWSTIPAGPDAPAWHQIGLGAQQLGPMRGDSGAIPGFLSAMLSDPSSGFTVVVMLNNSQAGAGFAQALAQRLASIASTATAVNGEQAPEALPWTEEEMVATMQAAPVCAPPAAAPAG